MRWCAPSQEGPPGSCSIRVGELPTAPLFGPDEGRVPRRQGAISFGQLSPGLSTADRRFWADVADRVDISLLHLPVGAWAHSSHFGRVCSQVPERGRPGAGLLSAAPSYPPPSAAPASSPRTCVWLPSGHPFVPLSAPLPTQDSRRWWQRRLEGGPEGWDQARDGAPIPGSAGSGVPPSRLALWLSLQHPRLRHHEQSEQLPCQSGARAPVRAGPKAHAGTLAGPRALARGRRQDALGVPGGESQPAAALELLLPPVSLVSAPSELWPARHRHLSVTKGRGRAREHSPRASRQLVEPPHSGRVVPPAPGLEE